MSFLLLTSCKDRPSIKTSKTEKTVYWLETSKGRRISTDFAIGGNVKVLWTDSLYEKKTFFYNSKKHELFIYGNSQYALGYRKRRKLVLDSIGVIYLCVPEIKVYNRIRSNDEEFNQLVNKAILSLKLFQINEFIHF